jgi:hypothetical protein
MLQKFPIGIGLIVLVIGLGVWLLCSGDDRRYM